MERPSLICGPGKVWSQCEKALQGRTASVQLFYEGLKSLGICRGRSAGCGNAAAWTGEAEGDFSGCAQS